MSKLPWSHNNLLLDKIRQNPEEKCLENGWSHAVLDYQIDLQLYERQAISDKLTKFENKFSSPQSGLARDIIKAPYIFELEGIKENAVEKDIENAMMEKIIKGK